MKDRIKFFQQSEKPKEEKPKNAPKKLDINAFFKKMQDENKEKEATRRLSLNPQLIYDLKIKEKLLNLNSAKEEKKEKEKAAPKKIDMKKQAELMHESLKSAKKGQDESLKEPPKKISMEDYLKKLNNSNKKYTVIKKKIPKKLDTEKILKDMIDNQNIKKDSNIEIDEDNFENVAFRNRSSTVSDRLKNIKNAELERKKKIEEDKRMIEEDREKLRAERKRREEERKRLEEERRIREEEERKEREKREEEEKIRLEEERKKLEEIIKKRKEEERKDREKKEEEERKEREKREEEERKEREKREEEERRKREEEERKRKEEDEFFKKEGLRKINKKEEDLSESELRRLIESERYEKKTEDYIKTKHREYGLNDFEGIDIKFTFEEINQISTESLNSIEVTTTGKILALTHKDVSKIVIYSAKTCQEEDCIIFESKVNSMKVDDKYIYCALDENNENILIISIDNFYNKIYLSGHNYGVTDLAIQSFGNFVSADKKGTVIVWKDNKISRLANVFGDYIDTICLIDNKLATLSFRFEMVKFYDLRYSYLECIETIKDIKGSGFKNNMLKLNKNILAISGTYIYIIDLNLLIVTNRINCFFANDSISTFHFNHKGYFFVSQALTHIWDNNIEKGTLAYYQYNFNNEVFPEKNTLVKLAFKTKCHNKFISSIKQIDSKTIVTGSFDGKIKFWILKEIE